MAKTYAVVVGAVLLLVGIVGVVMHGREMMGMHFGYTHSAVHIASGLIGLYCGLAGGGRNSALYAKLFGMVYTAIAIAGFAGWTGALGGYTLGLNTTYNGIHVVVGIAGLAAGFMGAGAAKAKGAGA